MEGVDGCLFFHATELCAPESVRPYLGDPVKHWKRGASAFELATSWIAARDIPVSVRGVLAGTAYEGCAIAHGFFERKVSLRTPGRDSQTDLMLLVRVEEGLAVIAVEGKALESFGPVVADWLVGEDGVEKVGRRARLNHLCGVLTIDPDVARPFRYQLLHRTVSALFEAERYAVRRAMVLVHAFAETPGSVADFEQFAAALGIPDAAKGRVSTEVPIGDVMLSLAWVQDVPSATPSVG